MSDNAEILDSVHKRMVNELLGKNAGNQSPGASPHVVQQVMKADQNIRKSIADLFIALEEINDPQISIELLSEHVTIMVEMINNFKKLR